MAVWGGVNVLDTDGSLVLDSVLEDVTAVETVFENDLDACDEELDSVSDRVRLSDRDSECDAEVVID